MLPFVALALLAIPVIEIVVLIQVGGAIGAWNTVGLLIAMAVGGTMLLRAQGMATLARVQNSLARNVFPAAELFDGACLLFAGILMLVPGFLTDVVALPLFFPPFRALLRRLIWGRLHRHGETRVWVNGEELPPDPPGGGPASPGRPAPGRGTTIDGTWHEVGPPDGKRGLDGKRLDDRRPDDERPGGEGGRR